MVRQRSSAADQTVTHQRATSSRVSYGFKSIFTCCVPLPAVAEHGPIVPACASHDSTLLPLVFSVTVRENGCALSLKKKYTSASFSRRVMTRSAVSGASSETDRAAITLFSAASIAGGTSCGAGGEAGGCIGGVGVGSSC